MKNHYKIHINCVDHLLANKPGSLGFGITATLDIIRSNHVGVNVESEDDKGKCFNLLYAKSQQQAL